MTHGPVYLNGRFNNSSDNFTSISKKGKGVVDYMIIEYDKLEYVADFKVNTITDLVNVFSLKPCNKMPDHSLLQCKLRVTEYSYKTPYKHGTTRKQPPTKDRKYVVKDLPEKLFNGDAFKMDIINAIHRIEQNIHNQELHITILSLK